MNGMSSFFRSALDFFFPPLCHVCRQFIETAGPLHICNSCLEQFSFFDRQPLCTVCGIPFDGAGGDHICGKCLIHRPCFDAARAACLYDGPGMEMIHAFKYSQKSHLRKPLALLAVRELSGFVEGIRPDLIVPVPLHGKRLRQRGFNQAVLLGELLSREWGVAMERRGLQRSRWTEPQINLTAEQRRENVKGAFAVRIPQAINGRRILLVDDVLTTGSTVDECARVLKRGGAAGVYVVTVARAVV